MNHLLFAPELLTTEARQSISVQQTEILDEMTVELIRGRWDDCRHHVFIGARGLGKSHLLACLEDQARQLPAAQRPDIARLPPQAWGITTWGDVAAAIRDDLGERASEAPDLAAALEGRRLLLLADDLDRLLAGMKRSEQKRLRDFLTSSPVRLVATSLRPLKSVAGTLFEHTIENTHLPPLRYAETLLLIERLARERSAGIAERLRHERSTTALRALHHVAAGNHRIVTRFAQILTEPDLDTPDTAILHALEVLTPESPWIARLSPQQRKIVAHLGKHGGAMPVKDIAGRCGMTQQTASSQLKALRDCGELRATPVGREAYYELTDSWQHLALTLQTRRGAALRPFLALLGLWHGPNGLGRRLGAAPPLAETARVLERQPEDTRLWARLAQNLAERGFENEVMVCERVLERLAPTSPGMLNGRALRAYRLGHLDTSRAALEAAVRQAPGASVPRANLGVTLAALGEYESALNAFDDAIAMSGERPFPSPWLHRAATLLALGEEARGRSALDTALEQLEEDPLSFAIDPAALFGTWLHQAARSPEPGAWLGHAEATLAHFEARGHGIALAYALLHSLPTALATYFPFEAVRSWLEGWHRLTAEAPYFQSPLRILTAAIAYRETPDPRPLLSLTPPERQIAGPILALLAETLPNELAELLSLSSLP